jgi:hypothetical protein
MKEKNRTFIFYKFATNANSKKKSCVYVRDEGGRRGKQKKKDED